MPDGSMLCLLPDPNNNGSSTPNEQRVYLTHVNSARTVVTQIGSWYYVGTAASSNIYLAKVALVVDQTSQLHAVYNWRDATTGAESVRYRKITGSGTSWSIGAEE